MGLFRKKPDKGKITERRSDGGYTREYKDGTIERVRFTKTREVHDFDGPSGKASIWSKRKNNLNTEMEDRKKDGDGISFIGKLHEITFYCLIATIFCLVKGAFSVETLWYSAFDPSAIKGFFQCVLFWGSVSFVPVAIIGAFCTKYLDKGKGLFFESKSLVVIFFAHIAEEVLGLIISPFWFLFDIFTGRLTFWKTLDFILYVIELVILIGGIAFIWML